jgi:UDPglucose--hexose-1-phosphate uridylyltransferase
VSRSRYELLVAPAEPEQDAYESPRLAAALRLLAEGARRVAALEGPVPFNAWLHDTAHWHLELFPRLNVLAGAELGAGWFINALAPEEAAARLREAV